MRLQSFIFNPADQAAQAEEQREDGGRVHEAVVALERGKPVRDDLLCLPPHPGLPDSPSPTRECLGLSFSFNNVPFVDSLILFLE